MKKLIINTELSYFRKWTRQSYSIFNSIKKECVISSLLVAYLLVATPQNSFAQADTVLVNNNRKLDEVVVSAQRASVTYSQMARVVTIMDKEAIESAPVQSLQDLLEYVLNVDVRQRGNHGVQADVSIRGGSFDQTMILLDGVNITDPQTGHLSLNLPVDIESIERVEVLQGPGARVYGPNAFSGAINFITGTGNKNNLKANISVGPETLALDVSAIMDNDGKYIAPMLTWSVVTVKLKSEEATERLNQMIDKMPINSMMCDPETFVVTYANETCISTLRTLEQYLPIKAKDLVGTCIDVFHKDPSHQRRLLSDPSNLPWQANIAVGPEQPNAHLFKKMGYITQILDYYT